ncbi:Unknown protein [Striga hermonthica]|uniref:F-box associated beta-propeller type 3 domain-containing protein n=1 Tax=Striga hermonthica TaxID=68872 RepID=A0A9N7N7V4_STRHE|nr:Unknown protein [Striga hermonthica]
MLKDEEHKTENIYISNPTTGQIFVLPPFVGGAYSNTSGIAYASASMAYKVVLPISPGGGMKEKCYILTVGVDKSWRAVDLGHLSIEVTLALRFPPVITEGFIHWLRAENNTVLTLNVETETITKTPGPRPSRGILEHQVNIYLSTGKYLSLLRPCGEFSWQVWEMRPENGEWRKTGSVCLESRRSQFERLRLTQPIGVLARPLFFNLRTGLIPVGWVKYMELLALSALYAFRSTIFIFNLVTGEFDEIELPTYRAHYTILLHKSSLAWLCG